MPQINAGEFRKGIKVVIEGDPYDMLECNFVKPGKGQALYKCRVRNLLRGTVIDRTWKSGDSVDAADISEIAAQYLYRSGEKYVFMDTESFFIIYSDLYDQNEELWKTVMQSIRTSTRPPCSQ